jgi:hypothetical protein
MNFLVMPGHEWLELLCKHIPDRHEHLVRYVGWYSNRARGGRAKALRAQQPAQTPPAIEAPDSEFATRAKATWAPSKVRCFRWMPLVAATCPGSCADLQPAPGMARRAVPHRRAPARRCVRRGSAALPPGPRPVRADLRRASELQPAPAPARRRWKAAASRHAVSVKNCVQIP